MFGVKTQGLHDKSVFGTDAFTTMYSIHANAGSIQFNPTTVNSKMTNSIARSKAKTFSKKRIIGIMVAWLVAVVAIALTSSFSNGQEAAKNYKSKPLKDEFRMVEIESLKDDELKSAIQKNKRARAEIKRFQNPIRDYLQGKADYGAVSAFFKPFFDFLGSNTYLIHDFELL